MCAVGDYILSGLFFSMLSLIDFHFCNLCLCFWLEVVLFVLCRFSFLQVICQLLIVIYCYPSLSVKLKSSFSGDTTS